MPFFDLNFYVWQLGPVAKDLYVELSPNEPEYNENVLLENYITKEIKDNKVYINSKIDFCDDEFSDLELELLGNVIERFKYCTANELINFTHRKNSPWYNAALKNGVLDLLESKQMTTTEIKIDLSPLKIRTDIYYKPIPIGKYYITIFLETNIINSEMLINCV